MKKKTKIVTAVVFALPLALFAQTVFLDAKFEERDLDTQNLPTSARWFGSSSASTIARAVAGKLRLIGMGEHVRVINSYFTPGHAPVSLDNPGDKFKITAELIPGSKVPGSHSTCLRIGVLRSGDNRKRRDGLVNFPISGYGLYIDPPKGIATLRARDGKQGNLLSSVGNFDTIGSLSCIAMTQQGVTYTTTIEIERLENDTVSITLNMSDGTHETSETFVDALYKFYEFDTIAFGIRPAVFGDLLVDSLKIESNK